MKQKFIICVKLNYGNNNNFIRYAPVNRKLTFLEKLKVLFF